MALIRGSASDLLIEARAGHLHTRLRERAGYVIGTRTGIGEVNSWQRSLPILLQLVVDAGLEETEVLLEHQLPHSRQRIDVVLCGVHPRTAESCFVFVELKQWSKAELYLAEVLNVPGMPGRHLHPVEQVRGYCQYVADHTPALVERSRALHGFAYLHNARRADVASLFDHRVDDYGRLFTMDDNAKLADHLRSLLDPNAGRSAGLAAGDEFLNFEHRPTKPLLTLAAQEIQEREQFVLLDEQKVAYELVLNAVERSRAAHTRTIVVVEGGPGSGKSVIALSLLGELARRGQAVHHATGSKAFTQTMRKYAGRGNQRVKGLFKYFNSYVGSHPRELDVVICDEAHRIRENGINRFTKKEQRERAGRQIDELINIANVPVFLLDENQIVRPGEMGSLTEITAAAEALGCEVEVVRLRDQMRCGGSVWYDTWVARLLGLGGTAEQPIPWSKLAGPLDQGITLASASSPESLEAWVLGQQAAHGGVARLTAGYCWRWSDPVGDEGERRLVDDVRIGSWERPWNAKSEGKRIPDVPESDYWATDTRGFGQVGCIYTAQGFEYDWSGVIFGPDLVRRDGMWTPDRSGSKDPLVKRADDPRFTALVKNTYKVLLTRGMRGTAVYSTDPETQAFLEEMTS
ncbi:DNA/RNA helicase domain-containing protein [Amycolatopsis sp. NPDC088138]|uniref:DNA/RNA helicase domain-containing protein n=1 Tax=Amycolatopsis sp. NPDC088138 TaxID=3363938 RepID=UPI0037F55B2B